MSNKGSLIVTNTVAKRSQEEVESKQIKTKDDEKVLQWQTRGDFKV